MANTINSVTLSTYSLNLQNGNVGRITATVDCSDTSSNEKVSVVVSDTDFVEFYGQSRKEDGGVYALNPNDNILYFKAKQVGNTTVTIRSVTDPTKFAMLNIDIYMSNIEGVTLSENNIWVEKGGNYSTNIVATVVARYGVDEKGVTLEYSASGVAWVTMLTRSSVPDKTWLSVSGINDGVTKVKVKSKSDPTAYETLTITVGKGVVAEKVQLSKTSLVIARNQVVQVKAQVITSSGVDRDGVSWETSGSLGSIIINSTGVINQDGTYTQYLNVKGKELGYTTVKVYSNYNRAAYEYLYVRVVENESDIYPTATILVDPTSITVPLNTEFTINGSAIFSDSGKQSSSQYETIIDWSSNDNSIVSVIGDGHTSNNSNCRFVSGSTPGTTTVVARYSQDSSSYAICTVEVISNDSGEGSSEPVENPVASVSINREQLRLAVGSSYLLKANVSGTYSIYPISNPEISWSTSDDNIVSVNSDGSIYAFAEGRATITARSVQDPLKFATCVVYVYEPGDITVDDDSKGVDTIIRVDYNEDGTFSAVKLFEGDLNFSTDNPIESVVYHETEDIQKIYWVDGKNVLRFMNFMAEPDSLGRYPWQDSRGVYDTTYFDSNRVVDFGVDVKISKDNSGNTRPNGVVQYLLTYYNKHGQESGYVWISDLIYLSPVSSGGAADGTNNNSVTLNINNLDTRFSHFRVYSVFRSSLNGTTVSYIVFDGKTDGGKAVVVDNNSHLTAVDSSKLLYLGSQHVIANTLTHKDQTLFLGDLSSVDRDYDSVEKTLRQSMLVHRQGEPDWECDYINFVYDDEEIPNETGDGNYSYNSQLVKSSSEITSFKGGEKYRFGIVFHKKDGTLTDAFWIGDKVNYKYPQITDTGIKRIIAECTLPIDVVRMMKEKGYSTAQLMIAEATYADRAIKAQGIVCPTVFNVWNRYLNRVYSASSWMMRPRNAEYAWKHFEPIHNSTSSTGEIDCNYWETQNAPAPYYSLLNYASKKEYAEEFDGESEYGYAMIIYRVFYTGVTNHYYSGATVILIKDIDDVFNPSTYQFSGDVLSTIVSIGTTGNEGTYDKVEGGLHIRITNFTNYGGVATDKAPTTKIKAWTGITKAIREKYGFFDVNKLVTQTNFIQWCNTVSDNYGKDDDTYFNKNFGNNPYDAIVQIINDTSGSRGISRWIMLADETPSGSSDDYIPAYRKKHLSFIDENVVTLNSPEIEYEAISFDNVDGYKFRIVGVAKIDGQYSDYTVDASPGKIAGECLAKEKFSYSLISWPLWKEYGLDERTVVEGGQSGNDEDEYTPSNNIKDRTSYDYIWGGAIVRYWLHMWNHSDKISGYTDYESNDYSRLIRKVFANSRYSNKTIYSSGRNGAWSCIPDSIRIFNYTSSQYVGINIDGSSRNYDAVVNDSLMPPSNHKYPVLFSVGAPNTEQLLEKQDEPYLYLSDPVSITYSSTPHAVISLPTDIWSNGGRSYYRQTILPYLNSSERFDNGAAHLDSDTGRLLPWIDNTISASYPYLDYIVKQDSISGLSVSEGEQYVFIGEIYSDLNDNDQIRFGGTSDAAIQNNRFLIAGPQYRIDEMEGLGYDVMVANQADTYIQRWDCMKTKPYSTGSVNNVIDITSVMLETHINIDGRTDLQRGTSYIASIDTEKFGSLNHVYSQNNNFITQHDLDEDFNLDAYRSSITWTLEKHDSADVDEWTHITLASTLKLDGDKGICRALRRINNSIISFQDRGISELLFNSRTQLSTQDGVPVEIANSGKVDGKRYITNKYGCVNKWSIIEGKNALYFVDNINKAFCAFNGQAIDNLSTRLGFGAWFREINDIEPWKPLAFNNIVSYYDKVHSDIYLVRGVEDDKPCLVYNETLGAFTSFFDYRNVLMMANVQDRFVSFNNHALWLQNEGLYCNFFGQQFDYWTQYRVTPEPYSDKIWTNIDYRADFFEVLGSDGNPVVSETELINGDVDDTYKEWETFTDYKVWDEYQSTGFTLFAHDSFDRDDVRKKFRIWRLTIPRALKEGTNKHGMDRIRNPWINLLFRKNNVDGKYLMQLHDIVVKYFE